ncbi:methyltransferase domain-containing protein [Ilyonectria destructans]|nr:methyltransferase domain-containing protein [Ilyonectria destructans]
MSFLPSSFNNLEEYTGSLIDFINSPLIRQISGGIHVNDAIIHDAWGALPQEWTAWWDSLPDHRLAQQDLIESIDEETATISLDSIENGEGFLPIQTRPRSLVDWLQTLKSLSLSRIQQPGPKVDLPQTLKARMNTKKIAEVSTAAAYIGNVCQANNITHVIDMGSGQGYLSNSLVFLFPSLRVLAIDGSESQIAGSKAFAASLGISEDRLSHLVRYIDGDASLIVEMEAWARGEKCMLVGLHACGQLSEHMLRYFATAPSITSLGAVGCCYNHIIPHSVTCPDGFPISARLRSMDVTLSPTALMTGCQAPNNWQRADLTGDESIYTKRRFYRTLLEKLFFDKGILLDSEDRPVWATQKGDLVSFEKFATRAMRSLGIDPEKISAADMLEYERRYQGHKGKVAILWTLSILCCKIVESVIALDRYWFLIEQGAADVDVVAIFDYKISPRNLMIVAKK